MSNDLHRLLHHLADDMTDTDFTDLRTRVDRTSRRIGQRRAMGVAAASLVAIAVVAGSGYALAASRTPGPGPAASAGPSATASATTPSPTATPTGTPSTPQSPGTAAAPPTAVPGTLVYLTVKTGQPIVMTTVTDGVAHQRTFATATVTDTYLLPAPSPDTTRLLAVRSPDPGSVKPADLVVISTGGARHTIATGVTWEGGRVPVWLPDGQHVLAIVDGRSSVIDVTTGEATPAPPAEGIKNYLTWSANGRWRAYSDSSDLVVTAADGSGMVRRSLASIPECQQGLGCPGSVQAVTDDGRYVALGHHNTDPQHVHEAHLVFDMRTGKLVDLPHTGPDEQINKVYFRPDGVMIVRTGTNDGKETFVLMRPDGTRIATFRDMRAGHPAGSYLVAYHP